MPEKKAVENFENKNNCVVSILKAFRDEFALSDQDIENHKNQSGGRAEGGLCGALYAAKTLLGDEDKKESLEKQFSLITGSPKCREIKSLKKTSCKECVGIAAKILKNIQPTNCKKKT